MVKRLYMCKHCNDKVACFQAVITKFSHTGNKQLHKSVSPGVSWAFNVFGNLIIEW